MTLQQRQLDEVSAWLDRMEEHADQFTEEGASRTGANMGTVQQQMDQHKVRPSHPAPGPYLWKGFVVKSFS